MIISDYGKKIFVYSDSLLLSQIFVGKLNLVFQLARLQELKAQTLTYKHLLS